MAEEILFLAALIIGAKLLEELVSRANQPPLLGHMLAGIILGPAFLSIVRPVAELRLFIEIGIFLMFFFAGFEELDIPGLVSVMRKKLFYAALITYFIPFAASMIFLVSSGFSTLESFAISSIISMSSLGVVTITLMKLRRLKDPIGLEIFSMVAIIEFIGIIMASIALEFFAESAVATFQNIILIPIKIIAFFTIGTIIGLRLLPKLFRLAKKLRVSGIIYGMLLGILLLFVYAAEVSGLHGTMGALLFGAVLSPLSGEFHLEVVRGLRGIAYGVFIPIFFAGLGLYFDLNFLILPQQIILGFLAIMIFLRFLMGYVASKIAGLRAWVALSAGILSKGGVDLAFMLALFEANIIREDILALYIFFTLTIVIASPIILQKTLETVSPPTEKEIEEAITPTYIRIALTDVKAGDVMSTNIPIIPEDMTIEDFLQHHIEKGRRNYLVVDKDGRLIGVVSIQQVKYISKDLWSKLKIGDIARRNYPTATPDQDLYQIVELMNLHNAPIIPITHPQDPRKILGAITRSDIIKLLTKNIK